MRLFKILSIISLFLIFSNVYATDLKLSTASIMGKQYYIYNVGKDESLYGIAKKFGWDADLLLSLNRNVAKNLNNGDRLYYPVDMDEIEKSEDGLEDGKEAGIYSEYEPIVHKVKKGETIYGISKTYNIPLEVIYDKYPGTKHGVKPGDILVFEQSPESVESKYYFYNVKSGDTLFSLANEHNTSVERLLADNPGVSERNFKEGQTLRIKVNDNDKTPKKITVVEDMLINADSYKVSKNDTESTFAEKTGVEKQILNKVNDDMPDLKPNETVSTPVVETVEVEKIIDSVDEENYSSESMKEIYDSIHGIDRGKAMLDEINVAILLDDPASNKDVDFMRGFLVALKQKGKTNYKVNLKTIDGRVGTGQLENELEDFEPHLVISTADKGFPAFLADYGNTNSVEILNVFDLRNDLYEDNPSMVQLLPPSPIFNENVAEYIIREFGDRKFLFVGEDDGSDGVVALIKYELDSDRYEDVSLPEFLEYEVVDSEKYIVYSLSTKKEEINDVFLGLDNIKERAEFTDLRLIGRQNWILFEEDLSDLFGKYNTLVPSKAYPDMNTDQWDEFEESYEEMFGGSPVKSFPNFAASGFDTAGYFIDGVVYNLGDFNRGFQKVNNKLLQSQFDLKRVNNWGGFINTAGYLLQYNPVNGLQKIIVK